MRLTDGPVEVDRAPVSRVLDSRLTNAQGEARVIVQLEREPLAVSVERNAVRTDSPPGAGEQRSRLQEIKAAQDRFSSRVREFGAEELARLDTALNAVVLRVDAGRLEDIARLPGVESVRPVIDYELDLSETVPYIGAAEAQADGVDGTGIKVAVLDSGVDYTHANLGGPGTEEAYTAAYGADPSSSQNKTREGYDWPTEDGKVYEGYDFVGEEWDGDTVTETIPDDDPIDFEGHGTHVADIIAGQSVDESGEPDGEHVGVAPGARALAAKVCSAVSSACEGVALLEAVDYSLDPNGDGDISDAVDVINMSLGSSYGQKEDDLAEASANAVRLGVVVVASAGNSADRPYIVGSPSSTPEVISVAQTQVPSAETIPLVVNSPEDIAGEYPNTATLEFAPIPEAGVESDVAYVGRGCPAGSIDGTNPEDPYEPESDPGGKIALIDRGSCDISSKISRATEAGATGVLIANNAPGDAPSFSQGAGDPPFAPTLVITQDTGQLIKDARAAGETVNVTISPENAIPLKGSVVSTSSRGPSYSYDAIKPDIGAPGASVSALAGTGDGEEAFGGTSGAAPMVAGSAALMLDEFQTRSPAEVKSLLMNTAETDIETNPATQPGELAPITRIGGGEVRVTQALDATTAAYDAEENTGSLSFGYRTVIGKTITITKRVLVKNYSNSGRTYSIKPRFRYRDDARSGAVRIDAPNSVTVPRQGQRIFDVTMIINGDKLPRWNLDGGPNGGDGSLLQGVEFDGYINISDDTDDVRVAFHVLPHKAANVKAGRDSVKLRNGKASVELTNKNGAVRGFAEAFTLTDVSPRLPEDQLPQPGEAFAAVDLKWTGVRRAKLDGERVLQFAVHTYGDRSHPNYPAEFDINIDSDRDGDEDYVVFNSELGGFGVTGQNVVNVFDVATEEITAYYYTDADLNSANAILTVPRRAVGLGSGTRFDFQVFAFDNYFTGEQTDSTDVVTYNPNKPRYRGSVIKGGIPIGRTDTLRIRVVKGGAQASPDQTGLLLLYRDARLAREAEIIKVRRSN